MTRPQHRRRPKLHKSLVCAALAIALQLSLLAVPELPEPISELGTPPAAAQSTPYVEIVNGTPGACPNDPVPWWPVPAGHSDYDEGECVLELPACPANPLYDASTPPPPAESFMLLSVPPTNWPPTTPATDPFVIFLGNIETTYFPGGLGYPILGGLERYPDFCELRVLDGHTNFGDCRGLPNPFPPPNYLGAAGHVYAEYFDGAVEGCRLLLPIRCPAGLQFATSKTCRGIQRRPWACATNEVPHNDFNRCIQVNNPGAGNNPACTNPPVSIALTSCEQYVGGDFFAAPASGNCNSAYPTDTPVKRADPGYQTRNVIDNRRNTPELTFGFSDYSPNAHWCQYNAHALRSECHSYAIVRTNAGCSTPVVAYCIKRPSGVGGCAAVAKSIMCRAYEHAYSYMTRGGTDLRFLDRISLGELDDRGCAPCLVMPFESAPSHCPPDVTAPTAPSIPEDASVIRLHENPADNPQCADPPAGRLESKSTHVSELAVVNAPVLVTIQELELEAGGPVQRYQFTPRNAEGTHPPRFGLFAAAPLLRYSASVDTSADARVRTQLGPQSATSSYQTLHDIAAGRRQCVAESFPTFRLVARELWPDDGPAYDGGDANCLVGGMAVPATGDAALILDLFGPESLSWWCALTIQERQDRTSAQGLVWWPTATMMQRTERLEALTRRSPCTSGRLTGHWSAAEVIRCRWVPTRSGFHMLHAGAVWTLRQIVYMQNVGASPALQTAVTNNTSAINANLQMWRASGVRVSGNLIDWEHLGLQYIGGVATLLPIIDPWDWKFEEDVAAAAHCPALDLRIYCNMAKVLDYSESPPIGVIVHEARVVTRAPSR